MIGECCARDVRLRPLPVSGNATWTKLILEGMRRADKLANYFSCALYCLLADRDSRQQLHEDKARAANILKALHDGVKSKELVVRCSLCPVYCNDRAAVTLLKHEHLLVCQWKLHSTVQRMPVLCCAMTG